MSESSPPPVEEQASAPWPFRILWRIVKSAVVVLVTLWLIITVAINFFAKGYLEKGLSEKLGTRVTIGAMRAGWDLMRPTIAVMQAKAWSGPDSYKAKLGLLEFGFDIHGTSLDKDHPDMLYYAGVEDVNLGGKDFGSYQARFRLPGIDAYGSPARDDIIVQEVKGEYRGAKISGAGSDIKGQLKGELTADNVDYGLFAEGVKGGKAHVRLDLSAARDDPVKTLKGHATLVGGDGKLEGNALNVWAGSLLTAFLPGQSKDTHLNCAVADFDVRDGVAHSKTVIIDTDRATITGTGTIDLVRDRVDMRFTPRTKGMAVLSLATPMVVSGPFGNITTRPDATGVAEKMGGLILGAVASPVALLPFLHTGGDNPCQKILEREKSP